MARLNVQDIYQLQNFEFILPKINTMCEAYTTKENIEQPQYWKEGLSVTSQDT